MNWITIGWARKNGLKPVNEMTWCGVVQGIPVTMHVFSSSVAFYFSVDWNPAQYNALNERLQAYAQELGKLQLLVGGVKLVVSRQGKPFLNMAGYDRLMEVFVRESIALGIRPRTTCEQCANPATHVVLRDRYMTTLCGGCLRTAQEKAREGSVWGGIIGALLGAMVAMGFFFAMTLILDGYYFREFGCYLTAPLVYLGYRLLNGRRRKGVLYASVYGTTLLITLIKVALSVFLFRMPPDFLGSGMFDRILAGIVTPFIFSLAGVSLMLQTMRFYEYKDSVKIMTVLSPADANAAMQAGRVNSSEKCP